ncbi:MAG TPA: hypothetical protein VE909_10125 [Xanthobacteraceae bacterium]|nr:hypothetical protein [Xanthobacteraceae bacterium]
MTAITYRKPEGKPELLIRAGNGIFVQMPIDVGRGRHDRAPETGRKASKLLRALVAYKQGKRK